MMLISHLLPPPLHLKYARFQTYFLPFAGKLWNGNWNVNGNPRDTGSAPYDGILDKDTSTVVTIDRANNAHIRVNLNNAHNVVGVQVVKGPNTNRFQNIEVWVGSNNYNSNSPANYFNNANQCGEYLPNNDDPVVFIHCDGVVRGQYLVIFRSANNNRLEIAELEVFAV